MTLPVYFVIVTIFCNFYFRFSNITFLCGKQPTRSFVHVYIKYVKVAGSVLLILLM